MKRVSFAPDSSLPSCGNYYANVPGEIWSVVAGASEVDKREEGRADYPNMDWYELEDPSDPKLDELAEKYHLHPLHIEDCRCQNERAKVDVTPGYTFAVLKAVEAPTEGDLKVAYVFVFAGHDFCITIGDNRNALTVRTALDHARREGSGPDPDGCST